MSKRPVVPQRQCGVANDRKRITFSTQTPFLRELRRRVDAHFATNAISSQARVAMYAKTSVIMLWFAASYGAFLFAENAVWAIVLLATSSGLALAGLGFCVQHDGGHGAYSKHKAINRAMAMVLDLLGGSSYVWKYKHNVLHHTYPNIDGVDDDICIVPLARLAPTQPFYGFHRWQHLYIWALYALITFKWQWWDDFSNVARGRIGAQTFPRPRGMDITTLVAGKLTFLAWALILPVVLRGMPSALLFYGVTQAVAGVTLASVFQLAHCVTGVAWAAVPRTKAPSPRVLWGEHQLATTVDFARRNRFVTWYLGGLNFQAVHHLFPKVCHVHYPALSTILEQTCGEFGVPYLTYPTTWSALASHYRWLRLMGHDGGKSVSAVHA